MSFAQRGADFLENLNPFAELAERRRLKEQERQRQEREQQERDRQEREDFNRRLIRADMDKDAERARIMAGQTFQLTQKGADSELHRELTRRDSDTTNATKVIGAATRGKIDTIGADYKGRIGLTDADYQGKISVINNLLRGQKDSQTSKQDFAKETLAGYQAHERDVLKQLVGPTPALELFNNTYLTALDRTIAADERLQAARRWENLVTLGTAALSLFVK